MRTWALLATLTIAAAALAGCSGGDGDGETTSSSTSSSRTTTSGTSTSRSSTSTTGSATTTSTGSTANQAPTGSLSVAVNGSEAKFTLDGTDADGETLVWDLSFGDGSTTNGTALPATVNHTYASTGNFTVNFTVTDGKDPVKYDLVVAVAGSGSAALVVLTGETTQPSNPANSVVVPPGLGLGANGCAGYNSDMNGVDCVFFPMLADYAGHGFTGTSTAGDPDLEFWDSCDAVMGAFMENFYATGPESGTVPDGAGCVILWLKAPPDTAQFTFTVI